MLRIVISFCCLLLLNVSYSQNVITQVLKPGPILGQDAVLLKMDNQCVTSPYPITPEFLNFGNTPDLAYLDWTFNSQGCPHGTLRSVIKFEELDNIPNDAVIISAQLKLYGVTNGDFTPQGNNHYPHSSYPYSNEGQIYRISSGIANSWDEQTITWNSAANLSLDPSPISIPASISQWNWNYTISGIDFVDMIQNMLGSNNNNGFLLKLEQEIHYRSVVFASSNHSDSTLWPELIIEYTLPSPCDASFNYSVNTNNPYHYNFYANSLNSMNYDWYIDGNHSGFDQNLDYSFSGPGTYKICLIVADSTDKCEMCYELCITENQKPEDNDSIGLHNRFPKDYSASYGAIQGDRDIWNAGLNEIDIYPNPTNGSWNLSINMKESEEIQIKLLDITGRVIYQQNELLLLGNNNIELTGKGLSSGTYLVDIKGNKLHIQEKVVKH